MELFPKWCNSFNQHLENYIPTIFSRFLKQYRSTPLGGNIAQAYLSMILVFELLDCTFDQQTKNGYN